MASRLWQLKENAGVAISLRRRQRTEGFTEGEQEEHRPQPGAAHKGLAVMPIGCAPPVAITSSGPGKDAVELSQQPLRFLLRQSASHYLLSHSPLAIKLVAFGEL